MFCLQSEMVLGGDNSAHREPFESFVKEYLQTGKLRHGGSRDNMRKPSWQIIWEETCFFFDSITFDSWYIFLPGEKELARLQKKVQGTTEDFKEVVDYFQYTGEGEEVNLFFLDHFCDLKAAPSQIILS